MVKKKCERHEEKKSKIKPNLVCSLYRDARMNWCFLSNSDTALDPYQESEAVNTTTSQNSLRASRKRIASFLSHILTGSSLCGLCVCEQGWCKTEKKAYVDSSLCIELNNSQRGKQEHTHACQVGRRTRHRHTLGSNADRKYETLEKESSINTSKSGFRKWDGMRWWMYL